MKSIKFFILLILFMGHQVSRSQTLSLEWVKSIGGTYHDRGNDIALDELGNVYTTGNFTNNCDFDPGPDIFLLNAAGESDVFVSKLDPSGNFIWAKKWGSSTIDESESIAIDAAGNAYITGRFYGTVDFDPGSDVFNITSKGEDDVFISKLDPDGNLMWAGAIGSTSYDKSTALAVDPSGNVCLIGSFSGDGDFDPGFETYTISSAGNNDIFILKLDTDGHFIWAKSLGGTQHDDGFGIDLDASGNVYTTGYYGDIADFDPGSGTYNLNCVGLKDIYVCKLDANGNFVWARSMGGFDFDWPFAVSVDPYGNLYITGFFQNTADFNPGPQIFNLTSAGNDDIFICKLDAAGQFLWAKSFGGPSTFDQGNAISFDEAGAAFITGEFGGAIDVDPGTDTFMLQSVGYKDIFITKLTPAGNFIWAKSMGAGFDDVGKSIAIDATGNVYTTGYFSTIVDFDPDAGAFMLSSAGADDAFVHKLGTMVLGAQEASVKDSLIIYPNPGNGIFILETSHTGYYEISDINGRIWNKGIANYPITELDLSGFASGIYFLKIGKQTLKLMKE